MALIHFKGKRSAIEVPEDRGKTLQQDWIEGKLPKKILLENIDGGEETFLSEDIRGIQTQKELDTLAVDEASSSYNDNFEKWVEEQRELRNQTPAEKAETNLDEILTTAMDCVGKNLTEQAKYAIMQKFTKFFEDNPNRIYVDFDTHIEPFLSVDKEVSSFNLRVLQAVGHLCAHDKEYSV